MLKTERLSYILWKIRLRLNILF